MGNVDRAQMEKRIKEFLKILETRALTPEERAEMDDLKNRLTDLEEMVAEKISNDSAGTMANHSQGSRRLVPPGAPKSHRDMQRAQGDLAIRSFLLQGTPAFCLEDAGHLGTRGIGGDSFEFRAGLMSSTTTGSYAREESTLLSSFERLLHEYSDYAKFCRVITTDSGEPLRMAIDADDVKGRQIPETDPDTEDSVSLDIRSVGVNQYTSNIALVSYELLRDQKIGIERLVSESLAIRVARILGETFTKSASNPKGLLSHVDDTGAGSAKIPSVTTAAVGALGIQDLVNLFAALPSHTQANPKTRWFMSSAAYQAYLKLQDGSLRNYGFTFNDGVSSSPLGAIMGKPISVMPELEDLTTGKISVVVGNPEQLVFRTVGSWEFQRANELYFKTRQIGFRVLFRAGFAVLNGNEFRALKGK